MCSWMSQIAVAAFVALGWFWSSSAQLAHLTTTLSDPATSLRKNPSARRCRARRCGRSGQATCSAWRHNKHAGGRAWAWREAKPAGDPWPAATRAAPAPHRQQAGQQGRPGGWQPRPAGRAASPGTCTVLCSKESRAGVCTAHPWCLLRAAKGADLTAAAVQRQRAPCFHGR